MRVTDIKSIFKTITFVKYVGKPLIKSEVKKYALKGALVYVNMGMKIRRIFIIILSTIIFIVSSLAYIIPYFVFILKTETDPVSSFMFWLAISLTVLLVVAFSFICSQYFWIKLLKINEIIDYFTLKKQDSF